jgi:hypothetical protein
MLDSIVNGLRHALGAHMATENADDGPLREATEWAITRVIGSCGLDEDQVDDLRGMFGIPGPVGTALVVGSLEAVASTRQPGGDVSPFDALMAVMGGPQQPGGHDEGGSEAELEPGDGIPVAELAAGYL